MSKTIKILVQASAVALIAGTAAAEGELNIYNWGNYTSPDLIEKFRLDEAGLKELSSCRATT